MLTNRLYTAVWGKLYPAELWQGIVFPVDRIYEGTAVSYRILDRSTRVAINASTCYLYRLRHGSICNSASSRHSSDAVWAVETAMEYVESCFPALRDLCAVRRVKVYLSMLAGMYEGGMEDSELRREMREKICRYRTAALQCREGSRIVRFQIMLYFLLGERVYVRLHGPSRRLRDRASALGLI